MPKHLGGQLPKHGFHHSHSLVYRLCPPRACQANNWPMSGHTLKAYFEGFTLHACSSTTMSPRTQYPFWMTSPCQSGTGGGILVRVATVFPSRTPAAFGGKRIQILGSKDHSRVRERGHCFFFDLKNACKHDFEIIE